MVRLSWLAQIFARGKRPPPASIELPESPSRVARVAIEEEPEPEPAPAPARPAAPRNDGVLPATRIAPQEELALKMGDGLKGLATLLSSIDERLVHQQRSAELVVEKLQVLPRVLEGLVEAERLHLETMRELRGALEKQGTASQQTAEKLDRMPSLLEGLGAQVERQTESAAQVKTSLEAVGQSVRGLVDGAQRAQSSLVTEFRRGQDEQRQRLELLVDRQRKTLWFVAVLGAAVVVALGYLLLQLKK